MGLGICLDFYLVYKYNVVLFDLKKIAVSE